MTYKEDRVERIAFDCCVKFPCPTVINYVAIAPWAHMKFLAIVAMGCACLVPVVVY